MTAMKVLVVVEDDPDVQFLIETVFSMDDRFVVAAVASSAEDALEMARTTDPGTQWHGRAARLIAAVLSSDAAAHGQDRDQRQQLVRVERL